MNPTSAGGVETWPCARLKTETRSKIKNLYSTVFVISGMYSTPAEWTLMRLHQPLNVWPTPTVERLPLLPPPTLLLLLLLLSCSLRIQASVGSEGAQGQEEELEHNDDEVGDAKVRDRLSYLFPRSWRVCVMCVGASQAQRQLHGFLVVARTHYFVITLIYKLKLEKVSGLLGLLPVPAPRSKPRRRYNTPVTRTPKRTP